MVFIIQLEEDTLLPIDEGKTIIDSIGYSNWMYKNEHKIYYQFLNNTQVYKTIRKAAVNEADLHIEDLDENEYIPIGSVEFCNWHLLIHNHSQIKAINIPKELDYLVYTKRKIWHGDIDLVHKLLQENKSLFIKSDRYVKEIDPMIVKNTSEPLPDVPYLISEVTSFTSEWRVFVRRGRALDCRQYLGRYEDRPNKEFIDLCISNYRDCPNSYTMDIGHIDTDRYAVIEVHNFVSCGLYGFEHRSLLNMIIDGWKYEINKHKA